MMNRLLALPLLAPCRGPLKSLSRAGLGIHIRAIRADMNGAGYRTRTCDPLITNQVLYQLS